MTSDTTPRQQAATQGAGTSPLDRSLFSWLDREGIWVGSVTLRTLSARQDGEVPATRSDPDLCLVVHGDASAPSDAHLAALRTILPDLPLHLGAVEAFLQANDIVIEPQGGGTPVAFRHQMPIDIDVLSVEACDRLSPHCVTLVLMTDQPDEWATCEATLEDGVLVTVLGREG